MDAAEMITFSHAKRIAQRFVAARLNALALVDYPGPLPPDLASAYACQDEAIELWPDVAAGWKIGKIADDLQARVGCHRLAGPIFSRGVHKSDGASEVVCGVFVGGFAAVEAEYVFEVGADAPPGKLKWTLEDAAAIAGKLFVGVEMAGSPLATINALGPCVIVSDFGNNADEIVGAEGPDWRTRKWEDLAAETFIEDKPVGAGTAANAPGTPLESLRFLAENLAARGRPLKAGMLISTGAATGVHDIVAGQRARVEFKGIDTIRVATKPRRVEAR